MNWQEVFAYRDGKLYWRIKPSQNVRIGDEAGCPNSNGHLVVRYKRKLYKVHRVIHEIFHGPIPKGMEIDHINGVRDDNRMENLRLVTRSQNNWNSCKRKNSTSGLKGVHWHKQKQKWQAHIKIFGKRKNLGYFLTKDEAYNARLKAEKDLHGEYAPSEERKELVVR